MRPTPASSPGPSSTVMRGAGRRARPLGSLSISVDDPPAVQVVRGQLDADAVAREDPDPVAAHLAGRVAQRLVTVVERDPEHAVPQRLDDLALELDLLFFAGDA